MLNIGIAGCGYMGGVHSEILSKIRRVKIKGVYDLKSDCARKLAEKHNTKTFSTIDELLNSGIDILYVTTPNTTHLEPVLKALQKNINVFSEKPMATSLDDAKKILDAAKKSKAIYNLGFNRRFAPVYKKVKSLIEKKIFIPYSAHIKMNRGELQNPVWVSDKNITGGFLYETTIHIFDMLIWFLGDVEKIVCFGKSNFYNEIDDFHINLKFKNGILATFTSCAHSSWVYPFERIELFGDHSAIITEEMNKVSYAPGLSQTVITEEYSNLTLFERWGYFEEDKLFIDAVMKNKKPLVSADDAYKSIQLVELCYKSILEGNKIISL